MAVREHSVVRFAGQSRAAARSANFNVTWVQGTPGETVELHGSEEQMLILPAAPARVSMAAETQDVSARTVTLLPPGASQITLPGGGLVIHLSTDPSDDALNTTDYTDLDPRIAPVGAPMQRSEADRMKIIEVDAIVPPADKPRLKMIQSSVMSINWVEYDGPRDRTALSPHNHADLEQGSLAIYGDFVHHLRVPWGKDANDWREDIHLQAEAETLTIIPVEMIHTTEGVGNGPHLLIDVFAPARADFIAKGWMCNGKDYT